MDARAFLHSTLFGCGRHFESSNVSCGLLSNQTFSLFFFFYLGFTENVSCRCLESVRTGWFTWEELCAMAWICYILLRVYTEPSDLSPRGFVKAAASMAYSISLKLRIHGQHRVWPWYWVTGILNRPFTQGGMLFVCAVFSYRIIMQQRQGKNYKM